jgi:peptidoglycan-associated lipoprotein
MNLMRHSLSTFLAGSLLVFCLSGCTHRQGVGDENPGELPADNNGDKVNLDGGSVPLPPRPGGDFNPDKDVDYQTLVADTVYFAFDSSVIPPGERPKLNTVEDWLKANPGRTLFLAGHADKRGTPEYNRTLGERRADSVREYLIGLGSNTDQIQTTSYGSDRPASAGDTEVDYAKNRRVEIGVIQPNGSSAPVQ